MKQATNTHFILTGATGILGSHILYELLYRIHKNDYNGSVVLLLRSRKDKTAIERYDELFEEALVPDYFKAVDRSRIDDCVVLIDTDITDVQQASLSKLRKDIRYQLIHCAASVNLGNNEATFDEIKRNNYLGTLNLIHTLLPYLFKVSFISTAFSSGHKSGLIDGGLSDDSPKSFRNPYEQFKAQTELEVVQTCKGYGLEWQIFRPSIICGRLVDHPHHVIPKFLVFYLFGAFFYRVKEGYGDQTIRITMNQASGLNLVPVDYAAKAIVRALDTDIQEMNIANRTCLPNNYAVPHMLQKVGWKNYEFTDHIPEDQNALEKLYYRTVGAQLHEYLVTPDHEFNIGNLTDLMKDMKEPDVFEHYLQLCDYAVDKEFNHLLS